MGGHPQICTLNGSNKAGDIRPDSSEGVDNDAEAEEGTEVELLEAVDAADSEEAAHDLRGKPSGGSHADDPDNVDMKIELKI